MESTIGPLVPGFFHSVYQTCFKDKGAQAQVTQPLENSSCSLENERNRGKHILVLWKSLCGPPESILGTPGVSADLTLRTTGLGKWLHFCASVCLSKAEMPMKQTPEGG